MVRINIQTYYDNRSQCVQGPCLVLFVRNSSGERLRMHHSHDSPTLGVAGGRLSVPQIHRFPWVSNGCAIGVRVVYVWFCICCNRYTYNSVLNLLGNMYTISFILYIYNLHVIMFDGYYTVWSKWWNLLEFPAVLSRAWFIDNCVRVWWSARQTASCGQRRRWVAQKNRPKLLCLEMDKDS